MPINCHCLLPRCVQFIPYELWQITIQFTCLGFSKHLNKFHEYLMTVNRNILSTPTTQSNVQCLCMIQFLVCLLFLVPFYPSSELYVKPLNSHFMLPQARQGFPYFLCITKFINFLPSCNIFLDKFIISETAQNVLLITTCQTVLPSSSVPNYNLLFISPVVNFFLANSHNFLKNLI